MAACGHDFTAIVTEGGEVWAWGSGDSGVLGLGNDAHQLVPIKVGGHDVFGARVVKVAAGPNHAASVAAGTLWTWGDGEYGQLGHGDLEPRQRPERLGREMFGGSPAVMVACGCAHTLVLTAAGVVWTCGNGERGKLGLGDEADTLVLTLVGPDRFRGAPTSTIVMVAAGAEHSVAVGAEGGIWTWGYGGQGRLGHNTGEDRLEPTLLAGEALGGSLTVLVAAGACHTVAVTREGALWVWGCGLAGQLGLGDTENRLVPVRVGAEEVFGGRVLMTACGNEHTLIVTTKGTLWTCGEGEYGTLGHTNEKTRLVPTQIEAHFFGDANIVSAAAGAFHSVAVTEQGALYTWGSGTQRKHTVHEAAGGLGHDDGETKLTPTLVAPSLLQDARVGRCHDLQPLHALAFAMGTHARLGRAAPTALSAQGMCDSNI